MDKVARTRIVYKLIAAGLQTQQDPSPSTNSTDNKEGEEEVDLYVWIYAILSDDIWLTLRNSLRKQNSISPKVGCAKLMILFAP